MKIKILMKWQKNVFYGFLVDVTVAYDLRSVDHI